MAAKAGTTLKGRAARLSRLLPATGPATAARTPFVLLVVVLLGGGLISLLLLNTSLNRGSFQLDELQKETRELTEEEQSLQQEVDAYSAPEALERRARELGMVPGGSPAFLGPDGTVRGRPSAAPPAPTSQAVAPLTLPAPLPAPSPTGAGTGTVPGTGTGTVPGTGTGTVPGTEPGPGPGTEPGPGPATSFAEPTTPRR
ncbi:septum formation initiator family protein [Streptomyces sp. GC420]|uniref:septum formation initiator family protein n=1 Tax=Streptomyces sp. GC420 TaxID=2697568 RepID=UPI001414DD5A|nr:septum formation initiator family protein [Streptomyces sp. GC420]NBM18166.1 septum formation initiator [Streptomyces sp. GC420]